MSSLAERVAARFVQAMAKSVALSFSEAVKEKIDALHPGIDWEWDARGKDPSSGFGWSGSSFSFPGKPAELPAAGILGGILVKGRIDGEIGPGTSNILELEAGYYHKMPGGEGKYSRAVALGTYDVQVAPDLGVSLTDGQDFGTIGSGVRSLVEDVVASPDPGALSKAMSPAEKKERDRARRDERAERFRQDAVDARQRVHEEQQRLKAEELEADRATHGSVEAFYDHIVEENDGVFGPADLSRVLQVMFKTEKERWENRDSVKKQLTDAGLTFSPKKSTLSAGPASVADELRAIAGLIESSSSPSSSAVSARIREILLTLT